MNKERYIKYGKEGQYGEPSTKGTSGVRTWHSWRLDVAGAADAYFRNPVWLPVPIILLYLLADAMFLATDGLLIATGLLEPALTSGKVRL